MTKEWKEYWTDGCVIVPASMDKEYVGDSDKAFKVTNVTKDEIINIIMNRDYWEMRCYSLTDKETFDNLKKNEPT